MFNEPTEREINLLPLIVHGYDEISQDKKTRKFGLATCAYLSYCIGGEGVFVDSTNTPHKILPGDLFYFAPEVSHSYFPVEDKWLVKYIVFSGNELKNIFYSLGLFQSGVAHFSTYKEQSLLDKLFHKLSESYNSHQPARHILSSDYLYRILLLISEQLNHQEKGERIKKVQKILPAIQFMEKNFSDKNLSLDMLSQYANISYPHLFRLIKNIYGMSPHDYLNQIRIKNAKQLLTNEKSMKIKDIADKCGFNSSGYFSRVFKSSTNLTPEQFRQEHLYNF